MLQPDKLKKLNENASQMAAEGRSKEEILAMKDAFMEKFGKETPVQKKKVDLESSSEVGSSDSQESRKQKTEEFENAVKSFSEKQKATPKDAAGQPIVKPQIDKALKSTFAKINNKVGSDKRISQTLGKINSDLIGKEEEEVVSQLSKDQTLKDLGFTFEESGALGDYVTVTAPDGKTTTEISLDNFLGSKSANQALALQKFIKDNTSKEKRIELDKIVLKEEFEEKQTKEKKKKLGDIFDKQLGTKPKVEDSAYLKERLASIDTDLINETEENVVSEMEYQFGDLGFKFEKTGILGDYMKVIAPNGKETEISLDNFLDSKSTKQAELLKGFIKTNTPAKGLFVLENTLKQEDKKFNSQKQVDDSIKSFSKELNDLNSKQKQFLAKKAQLDKQIKENGLTEELQQQNLALKEEMKVLLDEEETIKYKQRKLDAAVGKYTIMESKKGTTVGAFLNEFLLGTGDILSGITNLTTDIYVERTPTEKLLLEKDLKEETVRLSKKLGLKPPTENQSISEWKKTLTEEQIDEWEDEIDDYAKKDFKKEMLPLLRIGAKEVFGDRETTQQFADLKKEGFWGGAILGLARSLPAMAGGPGVAGAVQRTAQMYAQVSDGLAQEMENNPEFANISENEKLAITLPIGIVGAVLENVGLRNIKGSQGLINNITLRVLGKTGKGVTAKTFRELVENEVDSAITRGALTITAAGTAEFETGAAQELSNIGFKEIYNEIKGKEMFDTPDSIEDLVENVVVSGLQEGVGGFVLGVPTAVSVAYSKKGFLKMDDVSFEAFEGMANDENMQTAYVTSLKNQVTQGIITMSEAKTQLNEYRNASGLYRQLPEGLNTQQKKEAMNLLKEKRDLQNYVEGKDNALVVKQKERITEIDNSLTKLSETDAIQEQSTTEVPVQSETITSETMETGVPESGPEVVTEQAKKEEVTAPQTIIEEQPDVVKVKKSDDFMNDAEQVVSLNGEEAGRMYYDRSSKAWRDPNFDKSKYSPESFERIYGDILGDTKQEATDELIRRKKESMKQEAPIEETITEEIVAEEPQEVQFSNDTILNKFLNKLNSLNPLQKNPINNKSFVYGDKASLEFNRFDKGDKNEVSLEGITSLDKGKGLGKEAMTDITKSADELGTTLTLDAKPFGKEGLGKKELIDFYKKNGFEVDKQYLEDLDFDSEQEAIDYVLENESEGLPMVREPKISEPQVVSEVTDLLELDTKDQTSLQRVLDYLDSLDSSLDLDPNELNDVTRVMAIGTAKAVVKTLKALVKAGITLQEAIKAASEIHSVDDKDVLKAFDVIKQGGKQKSAPSATRNDIYAGAGRIISIVKDINKITISEKDALVKQIKDKAKGAKDAVAAFRLASQELAKEIKELKEKGNITATQAANIISKFSKVNLLNEASVSSFVDYMSKVFADADYDNKINIAKSRIKNAKKNIVTKLGLADGLILPLQRLFSINPNLIPEQYLDRYLELLNMFSARQEVLTLKEKSQVTKDVQEILDEINNEQSLSDELADRFEASENKVFKDDVLDYSASVKNMLKNGEIDENEAELMAKYKNRIVEKEERTKMTEEEIEAEKKILTKEIQKADVNSNDLSTRNEKSLAKRFSKLIKGNAINELTNVELKNILKLIDNINNGYLPHYTQLMVEKMNSINNSKTLENSVEKSKLPKLSYLYSKAKSILTKKDAVLELIRRNPLFYIDQLLGDFKTKDVFNSVLEMAAEGESNFTAEFKKVKEKLNKAQNDVAKSFSLNPNKILKSSFKMMTYSIQLEYESNKGNKEVNPAAEYLKATIKHINDGKSQFGEKDANMLQEIYDEFVDSEGNINNKKLYDSFNNAEKNAIKTVRDINESLTEKAEYTSAIIRGQKINPLTNYIHLNVLQENKPSDVTSDASFADNYNNSMRPSTKAKSLIERTGKVSPINFDIFSSAERGSKFVLMDYNLTEPIRTARKTLNRAISNLEKSGKMSKENRKIINAINKAVEEAIENLIMNSYTSTSIGDDVVDFISKQGYRGVLAGTGRFAAEFLSNVGFILISDPNTFTEGISHFKTIMSPNAPDIMKNVNSKETNRIFPSDMLSGRLVDTSILNQATGVKNAKAKNYALNRLEQAWNLYGKKYKNAVELTSDFLISTPDKAIMRPIWFGSFANQFEKIAGKKVDFQKIADNDADYMEENAEAIDKAKNIADERSVITGASSNAFTGILKGTSKPDQSTTIKAFNNFNNFMTRFLIYEYVTARTGIYAAMGNGSLSRKQGVALLGAVTTRMTVYSLLIKALGSGVVGLLFDDEEEEEKSIDKQVGQALASTFSSMLLGRDFGNATKALINYGVERVNENYLDFLREGDYDPYKDAIQYTTIPSDKKGRQTGVYDLIKNMTGSFGPAVSTADLIIKKINEPEKKQASAIVRSEKEKNIRIPLEVLGNLGYVPLYKDIRKSVMKYIYKDLEKEKKIDMDELKKINPKMYEKFKKIEERKNN